MQATTDAGRAWLRDLSGESFGFDDQEDYLAAVEALTDAQVRLIIQQTFDGGVSALARLVAAGWW